MTFASPPPQKRRRALPALCAALLLAACAAPGSNAIDALTGSSGDAGALRWPPSPGAPRQIRFLAMDGLLPVPGPGSACLASGARVANEIVCFSPDGKSQILIKDYEYKGTEKDLIAFRDRLLRLSGTPETATGAEALAQEAGQKNLFVFRWTGTGGANSLLIAGGLRVSQLLLGKQDFETKFGPDRYPSGVRVATLAVSAQYVLYAAGPAAADPGAQQTFDAIARTTASQGLAAEPGIWTQEIPDSLLNRMPDNRPVLYATMTDLDSLRTAVRR